VSGSFLLDWAALAVSLFNTILLVWLGLTVLLNAERRSLGVWLAAEGLLMGAAFFVSHSAILGQNPYTLGSGINFWWHIGWIPVVASPFAWYVLMLWYSGFWDERPVGRSTPAGGQSLYRRHLPWLALSVLFTLFLFGLLIFANPLPSVLQVAQLDLSGIPSIAGIPVLILSFPPYILLCILLSLDALLLPAPSGRLMGDLARRRARPWLVGATLALLAVSLLVGVVLVWLMVQSRSRPVIVAYIGQLAYTVAWFDLVLAGLLALAIWMLGQGVISYEVFTGQTLPRRGLARQWRNLVLLAAGTGTVVAGSLTIQLRPIYTLLLALLLMTVFYALTNWRAHVEREQSIRRLRPFASGPHLYEQMLTPPGAPLPEASLAAPFNALCQDVLGVKQALLLPSGPLAALAGPPMSYPPGARLEQPPLGELTQKFSSPQTIGLPLDPSTSRGMAWAVPLWSERGLIGLLLLGEKSDGSFFTQEEIEIARSSGERLVDIQASAEMARRLMALQRQRLAESQVLDRRGRRMLHDDVLPRLHTALLALSSRPVSEQDPGGDEAIELLAQVHRQVSDLLREMPPATAPEVAHLGLAGALRQVLEHELKDAFDEVTWQVSPEAGQHLPELPPLSAEVVFYAAREAMRNAALHARKPGAGSPLHLSVSLDWPAVLQVTIQDDGAGLPAAGGGESHSAGSGQGLALHSTLMAVIGGSLALESIPGQYTRVVLRAG
jgi:signal transduction histidine kinase